MAEDTLDNWVNLGSNDISPSEDAEWKELVVGVGAGLGPGESRAFKDGLIFRQDRVDRATGKVRDGRRHRHILAGR